MSILELNVKAKKYMPPPETMAAPGKVLIETGKKYITIGGKVIGPAIEHSVTTNRYYFHGHGWCDGEDGKYSGPAPATDKRSIACEWFETYEQYKAWTEGKAIEVQWGEAWYPTHPYSSIRKAFGTAEGARNWWMPNMDKALGAKRVRIVGDVAGEMEW